MNLNYKSFTLGVVFIKNTPDVFSSKFEFDSITQGLGQGEAALRRLLQGIELEVLADFIAIPGVGAADEQGPVLEYHIAVRGIEVQVFTAEFKGHFLLFITVYRHIHVEAIAQTCGVKFEDAR